MFKHRNKRFTGICSLILSLVLVMSLTIPMVGHAAIIIGDDDPVEDPANKTYVAVNYFDKDQNVFLYRREVFNKNASEDDIKESLKNKYTSLIPAGLGIDTFTLTETEYKRDTFAKSYRAMPTYTNKLNQFHYSYVDFHIDQDGALAYKKYEHKSMVSTAALTAEQLLQEGQGRAPTKYSSWMADPTKPIVASTASADLLPTKDGYDADVYFIINDGTNDDDGIEEAYHSNDNNSIEIIHKKVKIGESLTFPTTSEHYVKIAMANDLLQRAIKNSNSADIGYVYSQNSIKINTAGDFFVSFLGTPKNALQIEDDDSTPDINESTNPTEAEINNRNTATTEIVQATSGEDGGIIFNQATIAQNVEKIQEAVAESSSTEKKSVTINMAAEGANLAPADLLEAAKGKNVDLVFDMGTYTWTVNGNDITAANLKNINLKVHTDTENIPNDTVKQLAGNLPTKQLSLNHDGEFGFTATLTIKAPQSVGATTTFGNLFWYDSNGQLTFMDAGQVAEDGYFSVKFTHASDYVVVFGEDMTPVKSPPTGDNFPSWGYYVAVLTAGGFLFLLGFKKELIKK